MTSRAVLLIAGIFLAAAPQVAGQTTVVAGSPGSSPLGLAAVGGGDPFAATPLAAATPAESVLSASIGFSYLRPAWGGSGLSLTIPAGATGAAPITAPLGDLTGSFGFVPRLDLQYDSASLGLGAAASIQYISLGGTLERSVATDGGAADLTGTSDLSLLLVNLVEVTTVTPVAELFGPPGSDPTFASGLIGFSIGTRFASIRQNYHASLRSGDATATADATQSFAGLGLTASIGTDEPITERWGVYTHTRGSILLGQNNRKSSVAATSPVPGASFNNTLSENKTILVPSGELEAGVRFLTPIRRSAADPADGPLFSVRVGFVGQIWGNVGYLPASPGHARFDNRPLYLVGFTVLAGFEF